MKQDFTKYPLICKLADAVKIYEGSGPGKNNPGNIRCPVTNTSIWNHLAIGETSGFCNFKDEATGLYALREKFYNICIGQSLAYNHDAMIHFNIENCSNLTLYQTIQIYAPIADRNNPLAYANFLASHIGITINTVMKSLVSTISLVNGPKMFPTAVNVLVVPSVQVAKIQQSLSKIQKAINLIKGIKNIFS